MTTSAAVGESSIEKTVATAGAEARAVDVPLTINVGEGATIEMVTYKSETPSNLTGVGKNDSGSGWYHGYYDGAKVLYQKALFDDNKSDFIGVTVTITGKSFTDDDGKVWGLDALNGKSVDVKVSRKSVDQKTNRARFYGANNTAAPTTLPTDMTDVNTSGDYTVATNLLLSNLETTGIKCYFGVFIEGENASEPDTSNSVIGDFVVTVSEHV